MFNRQVVKSEYATLKRVWLVGNEVEGRDYFKFGKIIKEIRGREWDQNLS